VAVGLSPALGPGMSPRGRITSSSHSTTSLYNSSGPAMTRSKMLGRDWLPMWRRSLKPVVTTRAVGSPWRSSNALVAT